jgi:uncharacterized protein YqgC (DUF456 family)
MSTSLVRVVGYVALVAAGLLVFSAGFDAIAGDYDFVLPRSLAAVSFVCVHMAANAFTTHQGGKVRL